MKRPLDGPAAFLHCDVANYLPERLLLSRDFHRKDLSRVSQFVAIFGNVAPFRSATAEL